MPDPAGARDPRWPPLASQLGSLGQEGGSCVTNAPVRSNVRPAVSLRHYGASSSRADGQESAGASRSAPSTAALSLRDMSAEAAVKYIRDLYA